jgi:hypothetical protein
LDSESSKGVTAVTLNKSTTHTYNTFTTVVIVTRCKEQFVLLFHALSLPMKKDYFEKLAGKI